MTGMGERRAFMVAGVVSVSLVVVAIAGVGPAAAGGPAATDIARVQSQAIGQAIDRQVQSRLAPWASNQPDGPYAGAPVTVLAFPSMDPPGEPESPSPAPPPLEPSR